MREKSCVDLTVWSMQSSVPVAHVLCQIALVESAIGIAVLAQALLHAINELPFIPSVVWEFQNPSAVLDASNKSARVSLVLAVQNFLAFSVPKTIFERSAIASFGRLVEIFDLIPKPVAIIV